MKIKHCLILLVLLVFLNTGYTQSLAIKAYGLYNKTIQEEGIGNVIGSQLSGFDPKIGFQVGVSYQYPIYKSFVLTGEIGYLNKGHTAHVYRTNEVLYEVNYNYAYLKPSVGYDWHGLTLSAGLFFNFLTNENDVKKKTPRSTISKLDIAYSFELSYHYKRCGISVSTNESLRPMQEITVVGDTYEHYHHWYAVGLSYQIYNKKQNTSSK